MHDFIEKFLEKIKSIFCKKTKELPEKTTKISDEKSFFTLEKEKSQKYNYLMSLQKKLRQGEIKEIDLDEEDYVELELLYKQQIHQKENKIRNMKTKRQMS